MTRLDRQVHDATNAVRSRQSALAWSDVLARIARRHSEDMARRRFFDHVTPDGVTPHERGFAAGIECRKELGGGRSTVGISENLYYTTRYRSVRERVTGSRVERTVDWFTSREIAEAAVESWLTSPDHRENLLDPTFDAEGIGIALGTGDRVYITQVFC